MRSRLKDNSVSFVVGQTVRSGVRAARLLRQQTRFARPQKAAFQAYLEQCAVPKLQIGTGPNPLPGWLNTDQVPTFSDKSVFLDATKTFPLPDGVFEYVFSEHMIEHITYEQGQFMLRECYRVMKPGGIIRIATPNLDNLASLYTGEPTAEMKRYSEWAIEFNNLPRQRAARCFIINSFLREWGHQFVYDAETLQAALEVAGFDDVRQCIPGESEHEPLRNIEMHGDLIGKLNNQFETVVMDARR